MTEPVAPANTPAATDEPTRADDALEALCRMRITRDVARERVNGFAQLNVYGRPYVELVHMDVAFRGLQEEANNAAAEYDRAVDAYRRQFPATLQ